jgi:hypothetical protein
VDQIKGIDLKLIRPGMFVVEAYKSRWMPSCVPMVDYGLSVMLGGNGAGLVGAVPTSRLASTSEGLTALVPRLVGEVSSSQRGTS